MHDGPVEAGPERDGDRVGSTRRFDHQFAVARTEGSVNVMRSREARTTGGPTGGQAGHDFTFGDRVDRAGERGVQEWLEVDVVEGTSQRPTVRGPKARCLISASGSTIGRTSTVSECGTIRAAGLDQATAGIERGLQDLLLERLVPDHLGHQEVGALGQLDLPRPSRDERHPVRHPVDLEHPLGDLAMSLASTVYTRRAPARAAATARTPLPVPMSSTTSPGRTAVAIAAR